MEGVEKRFADGTVAVSELDLVVADGERIALVGPSGCGKTTVLRLVAGLETPTRGTIRIGGRAANELTPRERNVAMVFQDYALYPHRTVRGNLEFPLRMRGASREEIRRRVRWVAELLELEPLLDRYPRELSGGQRQRVAMGRALVREPAVFLLDEPLSNLDARLRSEVRSEIADLQRRTGTTMIYVTHDQVEAMTLGQRVAILDGGKLQQVGPPEEVYEAPANAFVAGFLGSPPMNLFPARIVAEGSPALLLGTQRVPVAPERIPEAAWVRGIATAGIRPEAIALAADSDSSALRVEVRRSELLGHEALVEVAVADGGQSVKLVARLAARCTFEPGSRIRLRLDPSQFYFFGPDGRALSGRARAG